MDVCMEYSDRLLAAARTSLGSEVLDALDRASSKSNFFCFKLSESVSALLDISFVIASGCEFSWLSKKLTSE